MAYYQNNYVLASLTRECPDMHLGGQIILSYLDLHLVIYSNLLVSEGQSSECNHIKKLQYCSEPRRTISSRLSKIKDFAEFTFSVESASTVDLSNQDFDHF